MEWKRLALTGLLGGLAFGAAGCTDGYGYSGVSMGYGSAYADGYGYGDGYYDDGYYGNPYYGGEYGGSYGYAPSYYGWYDNFYYPGTGIYIYDRNHRRYRWNDRQRHYWEQRRGRGQGRENWGGFQRPPQNWNGNGNGYRPNPGYRPDNDRRNDGDRRRYRGNRSGQGYRPPASNATPQVAPPVQTQQPTYRYQGRPGGDWQGRANNGGSRSRPSRGASRPQRD